ncbi:hypothetical protein HDF22_002729 [Mucilaginibacter lappiensis]|uniref:Uncharacterized protein n=1 Tax=Mucilaginibacter lappiensis TaxID=354630 RepID=A0A841JIU3_9SPHI|nr:hypothetical protein [Mucilaginibacter lappiensis]MBB6232717.1 hypothetical protein [Mucilaginibacter sp. FT3.2]
MSILSFVKYVLNHCLLTKDIHTITLTRWGKTHVLPKNCEERVGKATSYVMYINPFIKVERPFL